MSPIADFAPGQIWTFAARPQDSADARIAVLAKEDDAQMGTIYSVALLDVCIRNPHMDGGVQTSLAHAPVTEAALRAAAGELIANNGPTARHPDFASAYAQWHEPYQRGEAGVFSIPLVEILNVIEEAVENRP
ncbi:MAG: hypothetical protein R3D67_22010 [Hyphomicrobiaceae bacterium]